jgi:aminoglycoside phosphotransferase (APT) family kinase protein
MTLEDCLPAELRAPSTTIAPIAAGLSGAGVYRVEAAGGTFVLKIASDGEPLADWRRTLQILRSAADAGLAPPVVHADESRRALVSVFVTDRSLPARYADPRTREAALVLLGGTLRRVHALALPAEKAAAAAPDWAALSSDGALPSFVGETVRRVFAEEPPPSERAPVLSHNDVNPTNLVFDGEKLLLLDWERAGANDPLYDLATISVFLRMDDEACRTLLAAYDGAPVATLPARFGYNRRVVAVLCGLMMLSLARRRGHAGGTEALDAAPSLGDVYPRLRSGALSLATAEGLWCLGLALIKESVSLGLQ